MKRIALLALAGSLIASAAFAADLPVKASAPRAVVTSLSWSGFYLGGGFGYGFNNDDMAITAGNPLGAGVLASGIVPGSPKTDARGWVAGIHGGYNWQTGMFVFGIEADANFSDIDGAHSQFTSLAPLGIPISLDNASTSALNWYATLVGRVGITPAEGWLIYVKGGAAVGEIETRASATLTAPAPFGAQALFTKSDTEWGWTIGAGIEAKLNQRWSVGVDYTYLDFGTHAGPMNAVVLGAPVNFNVEQDHKYHVGKLRLTAHF
jgi:outer membrane immunogenic protein